MIQSSAMYNLFSSILFNTLSTILSSVSVPTNTLSTDAATFPSLIKSLGISSIIAWKGKFEAAGKFVDRMRKIQEKAKAALGKAQEKTKKQEERRDRGVSSWGLSMRDLKWQMIGRRSEKLTELFVGPYKVKGIVLANAIELETSWNIVNQSVLCSEHRVFGTLKLMLQGIWLQEVVEIHYRICTESTMCGNHCLRYSLLWVICSQNCYSRY